MNSLHHLSSCHLFELFQEEDELCLDFLEELVERLYNGTCKYSHLLPGDAVGIKNKAHWAGLMIGERQICASKRLFRSQEQIEEELERWSRANECWFTESNLREQSDSKKMFSSGTESVVYIDKSRSFVTKMMHPREGYDVVSIGEMLDGIALYNRVFSSSEYLVVGYGRNDAGVFCAVLKQPLIKGRTINSFTREQGLDENYVPSALDAAMLQLGFTKEGGCWLQDQYLVTDITGSNIVILPNGISVVIDADVNYLDSSFFGKDTISD